MAMTLQTKRIMGSAYSAGDTLEVKFDADGNTIHSVGHSIEHVSGPVVTHGGGGAAGTYLHYKSHERDTETDGRIDYSDVNLEVVQLTKGTSVIKVIVQVTTQDAVDTYATDLAAWEVRRDAGGPTFNEVAPVLVYDNLKTGNITLEWADDTFV